MGKAWFSRRPGWDGKVRVARGKWFVHFPLVRLALAIDYQTGEWDIKSETGYVLEEGMAKKQVRQKSVLLKVNGAGPT